jgi:hypothetical protein
MCGWIGMAAEWREFSPEPIDKVVLPEPAKQKAGVTSHVIAPI